MRIIITLPSGTEVDVIKTAKDSGTRAKVTRKPSNGAVVPQWNHSQWRRALKDKGCSIFGLSKKASVAPQTAYKACTGKPIKPAIYQKLRAALDA